MASSLLIVAGILLLKAHPLGRTLSIAYSLLLFAWLILVVGIMAANLKTFQENLVAEGMPAETALALLVALFGFNICLGAFYPILLLFFMYRPGIIRALSASQRT